MNVADTIVAISSAVGPAARLIVRLAGPEAVRLLRTLSPDHPADPASAAVAPISFAGLTVPAWVYVFHGPRSYTGDDLVELHLPGNPLLAQKLVETLIATARLGLPKSGVRPAEAGEFTARAFLNGRLDLTAAEGVALAVAATHAGELRAARQLLAGELSRRLAGPLDALTDALALVESNIDFAEEDIAFIDAVEVRRRVAEALAALDALVRVSAVMERPAGEPTFVLVGPPNSGKSALLNRLAGEERAVVSPVAGTTRDALSATVALRRGLVRLIDVAGLESVGEDAIERQMQNHARRAIERADFVIAVRTVEDDTQTWLPRSADMVVRTKADPRQAMVSGLACEAFAQPERPASGAAKQSVDERDEIAVSAVTGAGMRNLKDRLDALAFGRTERSATLALNARHVAAVEAARDALRTIETLPADDAEIVAEQLRRAINALGEVLGRVSPDDVLGRVFAAFCVGK